MVNYLKNNGNLTGNEISMFGITKNLRTDNLVYFKYAFLNIER